MSEQAKALDDDAIAKAAYQCGFEVQKEDSEGEPTDDWRWLTEEGDNAFPDLVKFAHKIAALSAPAQGEAVEPFAYVYVESGYAELGFPRNFKIGARGNRMAARELGKGRHPLYLHPAPPAPSAADDVKCVQCGDSTMHMGNVCYACSHPTPTEDKGGAWPDDAAVERALAAPFGHYSVSSFIPLKSPTNIRDLMRAALAAAAPPALTQPVDRPDWMAEVCNAAANAMEANGLANRTEQLRNVARQLAAMKPAPSSGEGAKS